MKLKLLFLLFFLFYSVNSSKLSQSACEIVSEVHKKENWIKTIAVVNFNKNFDDEALENLLKCLPMEISTLLIDAENFNTETTQRIHSPSMVVAFMNEVAESEMNKLNPMILNYYQKPVLEHNVKFLVILRSSLHKKPVKSKLDALSIVNYAIIFDDSDKVTITTCEEAPHAITSIDSQFIDKIYPSNSKCIKNQSVNVFVHPQIPRVRIEGDEVRSELTHFLDAVAKIDNTKFVYFDHPGKYTMDNNIIIENYQKFIQNRQFELTLNNLLVGSDKSPRLLTYEETGYCALVPINANTYNWQRIKFPFFEPFDILTWTFIIVSVVSCMIIWRLGSHSTSMWYIPFFFWAFLLGQSVNFATNRKIFVILLQILVFMLFILGNAYQGVITSLFIGPQGTQRLNSFNDILDHNLTTVVGSNFHSYMEEDPRYQKAFTEGRIKVERMAVNITKLMKDGHVCMAPCEVAKYSSLVDGMTKDKDYYVIDENSFSYFVRLHVIHVSKFFNRWQLLMDWSFEAGLQQAWKKLENNGPQSKKNEEKEIFNIHKIFYAYLIGVTLSIISLFCEIFWHDCVEPYRERKRFNEENLGVREIQRRKFKFLRRNPKKLFRIHQVRPINDEMDEDETSL